MVAYFSYLAGDTLGLSGIVALFCCAVTMSHYAMHNITRQQRAATMSAFETLSFLSEGSIFVYVGLDALDPIKWKVNAGVDGLQCIRQVRGGWRKIGCMDDTSPAARAE